MVNIITTRYLGLLLYCLVILVPFRCMSSPFNTFEYDGKSNLAKETFERSESVTGETIYHYDTKGILKQADCRGLNGWFYGIIEYEYSGDGEVGADIISKGEKIGEITFDYNDSGKLLSEISEFQSGWSQHFIFEYENIYKYDHV